MVRNPACKSSDFNATSCAWVEDVLKSMFYPLTEHVKTMKVSFYVFCSFCLFIDLSYILSGVLNDIIYLM